MAGPPQAGARPVSQPSTPEFWLLLADDENSLRQITSVQRVKFGQDGRFITLSTAATNRAYPASGKTLRKPRLPRPDRAVSTATDDQSSKLYQPGWSGIDDARRSWRAEFFRTSGITLSLRRPHANRAAHIA